MFYLTYRFNETAIITVTVTRINVGYIADAETKVERALTTFLDAMGTSHTIESATIISIVPAPVRKRKRGTC
jgi:hypothetical protein